MRIVTISSTLIALLIGISASADAQDKGAIEKKLTATYALTQPTADNTDIVTAGSILVLQTSNLMMAPVSSTNFYQNTYKDGKITQNAAGKVTNALGRFSRLPGASAPSAPVTRTYVKGEKIWVTKIEMKDDGVTFDLFTDAVNDVRYKAALKFQFPKGIALTADQVEKLVAEVFKVQPPEEPAPSEQQQPAAAAGRPAAPAPRGAPAPAAQAPPPPIEAPPPPIDAPPPPPIEAPPPPPADPKVIKMGEAKAQVIADFGQPVRIAQAAAGKEIYFYKDMKVTFTAGKVTNLE